MSDTQIRIEMLEEAIEYVDDAARLLQAMGDPVIEKEVLQHFEGNPCGWPGRLMRDILDERLAALRQALQEEQK